MNTYYICYKGSKGLEEINLRAAVLQEAKSKAMWYINNGVAKRDITIKLYRDNEVISDLISQYDFDIINKKWVKYE